MPTCSDAFNTNLFSDGAILFTIAEHFILECMYTCVDGEILFIVGEGFTTELYIIIARIIFIVY